MKALAKDV